ncbi:helix-turn-helix transcriptional regulator [Sphaerisporangium sp. NPDC049002]|uniref:helix-turn-helix domain-containing protein n=1 Tax=Sphaerisporangium sp. NPDC049002 TaxID=3155392 RepID=UPI0033E3191B
MKTPAEAERLTARLRVLKDRSGSSFESLARRSGISRSSLHRYYSGASFPASYETVHAFARACGASEEELRELRKLWAVVDITRSMSLPAPTEGGEEASVSRPPRTRVIAVVVVAAVLLVAAGVAGVLALRSRPDETPHAAVPIRVFNVEGDCSTRPGRVPACSLGLAVDPRLTYEFDNVVSHRVWHGDVLSADCVLYDGERVEDETGVGTTRWFRVRLDDVPNSHAWLPGVRTNDNPKLPVCAP